MAYFWTCLPARTAVLALRQRNQDRRGKGMKGQWIIQQLAQRGLAQCCISF
jgi:hypothetical protein